MNMKRNKPWLSLKIITAVTAAFFCGVGTTMVINDMKANENSHASIAIPRPITTMSLADDMTIECEDHDKLWQPAVLTAHVQDPQFTMRF